MQPRLNFYQASPEIINSVRALNTAVNGCGLEKELLHLVKLRASQINGCSYCVDMHSREAREDGESEQRLLLVAAWQESPLFTERERAALAWTEKLTRLAGNMVEDEDYEEVGRHFSEEELVKLSVAIGTINVWNRLCVPFRSIHPVKELAPAG
ncbi:carboxymuconolactone decarboxylase family protein [Chelativorans sp. M5D2P16]|uniref:carboxymuconolactone decarboxylase family protein n=1 Tax=Chelativorans sp. M5D2P16 TaxID=3095678 RepID=UPI002ACA7389|nr:carboxymuconolactone decarboxylase family protein [Chelativorans sp. M5D2P16]MDZ5698134.1 carboxymuconolactone decarboxylase family protein [Chelativorans sp. M5D2P16]